MKPPLDIAVLNFFDLFAKSKHYNTFQDQFTKVNPVARQLISQRTHALILKGLPQAEATRANNKLLVKAINMQGQIRLTMDYYEWIGLLLLLTIILITLFPYINKTIIFLRADQPAPF